MGHPESKGEIYLEFMECRDKATRPYLVVSVARLKRLIHEMDSLLSERDKTLALEWILRVAAYSFVGEWREAEKWSNYFRKAAEAFEELDA